MLNINAHLPFSMIWGYVVSWFTQPQSFGIHKVVVKSDESDSRSRLSGVIRANRANRVIRANRSRVIRANRPDAL